jgi:sphinganine-1-phosphate aldolase
LRRIDDIPGLYVIGKPDMTVVAFGSDAVDIFEVNDIMSSKGWHLNALQRPNRYKQINLVSSNRPALFCVYQ